MERTSNTQVSTKERCTNRIKEMNREVVKMEEVVRKVVIELMVEREDTVEKEDTSNKVDMERVETSTGETNRMEIISMQSILVKHTTIINM